MFSLFFIALAVLLAGAILSLLFMRHSKVAQILANKTAAIGTILSLIVGVNTLITGRVHNFSLHTSIPLLHIVVHIDRLAALFIVIISAISLMATIYGYGYMKQYYNRYNLGAFGFFFNIFIISMLLIATAFNGFYFVLLWEIMALSSLFLVLFEHKEPDTIKAGLVYFIMTHISAMFILAGFLVLYHVTGSFDFATIKAASGTLSPLARTAAQLCFLVGFGIKAGVIPLHIWLPKAHSAAPSHVSAMMSGVMIKLGILMYFRIFFDILPQPVAWLGYTILALGAISAVLGVLFALTEHDSKRLLAFHSIENIGIILLGMGSSLIFLSLHQPGLALLAAIASLFHTVNHATFKSLLFLSAGSVLSQTHTRNMEKYGGLIKFMPITAVAFLIGAIAISGLPPLNGFASEWLTYMTLFQGAGLSGIADKAAFVLAAGALALTSGLAIACFVKAFGTTFLARPRSQESARAHESSIFMTAPMLLLAIACAALGLGSAAVIIPLRTTLQHLSLFVGDTSPVTSNKIGTVHISTAASFNLPLMAIGIIAALIVSVILVFLTSRRRHVRYAPLWANGYQHAPTSRQEITPTGFSRSFIIVYRYLFRPTNHFSSESINGLRYFTKSNSVQLEISDVFDKHIYRRSHTLLDWSSKQAQRIQNGNLNLYLLYIFVLLLSLMAWVRWS